MVTARTVTTLHTISASSLYTFLRFPACSRSATTIYSPLAVKREHSMHLKAKTSVQPRSVSTQAAGLPRCRSSSSTSSSTRRSRCSTAGRPRRPIATRAALTGSTAAVLATLNAAQAPAAAFQLAEGSDSIAQAGGALGIVLGGVFGALWFLEKQSSASGAAEAAAAKAEVKARDETIANLEKELEAERKVRASLRCADVVVGWGPAPMCQEPRFSQQHYLSLATSWKPSRRPAPPIITPSPK